MMKLMIILACFFACMSAHVYAQEVDANTQESKVLIDEIVVTEIRSPRLWRLNIERAEDDVYQLFNRLVDNDDYRVECRREGTTQSRILVRSCEPIFVSKRRALNTRNVIVDWRSDEEDPVRGMENAINNKHVTDSELQHELVGKYEEMNQAMLKLALENPDLMRALERLGALRAAYLQHGTQHE
ncbi:hypothetical protein E3V39_01915 [Gammaproteobacteria bacterium LSUCC0112]|nr:hypothetical protein E3V39_01915 [Gammaproteobacteria bacterium LSUCC0112]